MSTTPDFIEFACEQLGRIMPVTYKKMFGEYMIYVNLKPIFLVCNNTVYVKMREEIESFMKDAEIGPPYAGAKDHYVLDIENYELCQNIMNILEPILKIPVKKKKKTGGKL